MVSQNQEGEKTTDLSLVPISMPAVVLDRNWAGVVESGSTARMVAHDALEPLLFTEFNAIEMESDHLCIVIHSLSLEEIAKPLGGQIVMPREDAVGDFVSDTIGKLDILPGIVAERVGCSK